VNIILFGPPGAGKGTQATSISNNFNLHKLSSGDLLRQEVSKNTNLGKEIKILVDAGSFVPDSIINNLIINILSNEKFNNRLVFDGYPRNLSQAENLDSLLNKYNQKITFVMSLNVKKEIIIKRILGRQTCANCGLIFNEYFNPSTSKNHSCDNKYLSKRSDDSEKIITNRFETYIKTTLPMLEFYKKQKLLHEINGEAEITHIYEEIKGIIASLET
jgi:adenylate kinase